MLKNISAFAIGLIFGFGLIIAQMSNPQKVKAFLDVAGDWDPSLAFVMASGLAVLAAIHKFFPSSEQASENNCAGITNTTIDAKLIIGASLFGLGWGLSGICPGPAIVGLSSGLVGVYVFVVAMFVGFYMFKRWH